MNFSDRFLTGKILPPSSRKSVISLEKVNVNLSKFLPTAPLSNKGILT
jgi:hypothetical protein